MKHSLCYNLEQPILRRSLFCSIFFKPCHVTGSRFSQQILNLEFYLHISLHRLILWNRRCFLIKMEKVDRDRRANHWSKLSLNGTFLEPHTHFSSASLPSLLHWSGGLSRMRQGLSTAQVLSTCCPQGPDPVAFTTLLTRVMKQSGSLQQAWKAYSRIQANWSWNPVFATYHLLSWTMSSFNLC